MPTSPSQAPDPMPPDWPAMPVETDIYILPDGRIVVADLPAELAVRLPNLGRLEPGEVTNHDLSHSTA